MKTIVYIEVFHPLKRKAISVNQHPFDKVQIIAPRRSKMYLSSLGINHLRHSHPWNAAWLSALIPGFGHIHLGMYLKGLILVSLEIMLNTFGKLNLAILYTFTLQFEKVHEVINYNWILVYAAIYVFAIWDSYRVSVEINKHSYLESKQNMRNLKSVMVNALELDFLDRRNPWVAMVLSAAFIGLGHLYCHRLLAGFTLIGWNIALIYFTSLPQLIICTFTGEFHLIPDLVNYQWLLFFPSLFGFAIYDSYTASVSFNRLFEEEQLYYLRGKYGHNRLELLDWNNK